MRPAPYPFRPVVAALLALLTACGQESDGHPSNLLLITIDTLRADHVGAYGYDRATTPRIDQLAAAGTVFERAYATSSWTLPSVTSMLTSLHPSTHACALDDARLAGGVVTLAECLQGAGFSTAAVTSHVYMARSYGLDQGFGLYDDDLILANRGDSHLAVSSPAISEKGMAWLTERSEDERWFLWLHYFDPHSNYQAHPGFLEIDGVPGPKQRYDSEIAWTDHHIGRVLDRLQSLGLAEDTVVIVVADHGEEFGDHGGTMHRKHLYEEVIRVPLIVSVPGAAPGRITTPVSVVDIMPTACELLGVAAPDGLQGRSLASSLGGQEPESRPILAELGRGTLAMTCVVDGFWKLIRQPNTGLSELYDLESDPGEQLDVDEESEERTTSL